MHLLARGTALGYILIILVILLSYFWLDITLPVPYNHLIYPGEEDSSAPKGSLKNEKKKTMQLQGKRGAKGEKWSNGPWNWIIIIFNDFNLLPQL